MFTERLILEQENDPEIINQHLARYEFAKAFVRGKSVLDIACGSGYGSAMLKEAGATKVLGIDISEETIEYAKAHFQREGIDFVVGNAEDLSSYRRFDVIVSFETIEHLTHPETFLGEIACSLATQGLLIISTPQRESRTRLVKFQNPFHRREWTVEEFKDLLAKYFSIVNIYGQYNFKKKWFPYSQTLQRFIFRTLYPEGFKEIDRYPVLSQPPTYRRFPFSLFYMIFVCQLK